jgi:tripartite-type tricarboxylate transporter receptor subunit TctC
LTDPAIQIRHPLPEAAARRRRLAGFLALGAAGALAPGPGSAAVAVREAWPARPVRFVVPSSPGGGTDTYARLLSVALGDGLGQQFVIENRPGGSGNIGTTLVAHAPADGYTFLLSANAAITINPSLYRSLPFDIERDLTPVARGVTSPMVLCASASSGFTRMADLIGEARRRPGSLAFGSAGNGSPTFLGVKLVEEAAGVQFLHVPYKGMGPAYQGLLGGELQFMLPDLASALPYINSGKLVALAANVPSPLLPQVPTFADLGYRSVELWSSFSVLAPAGTPDAIVNRLNQAIARAMRTPELAAKLERQALIPTFDSPEAFGQSLRAERRYWAQVIQRNHIAVED